MKQKKAIIMRPVTGKVLEHETIPVFEILLAGDFESEGPLTLTLYQVSGSAWANQHKAEHKIGEITGSLKEFARFHYRLSVTAVHREVSDSAADVRGGHAVVGLLFEQGAEPRYLRLPLRNLPYKSSGNSESYRFEGDDWELEARVEDLQLRSPVFRVAWTRRVVPARFAETKSAIYDWHAGNDVLFYQDATRNFDGDGYFGDVAAAIDAAQSFIYVVDWTFNPTVVLRPVTTWLGETLGAKLLRKAADNVLVAIHTWYHGYPVGEGANDDARQIFQRIAEETGLPLTANLLWRGGERGERYCSHHQKFVLTDTVGPGGRSEILAYFGGIDLSRGRTDTSEHPILPGDGDARRHMLGLYGRKGLFTRRGCSFDEWYNSEFEDYKLDLDLLNPTYPRQPWHDVHARLRGPVAWDLMREFTGRWMKHARADEGDKIGGADTATVWNKFHDDVSDRKKFIQQWEDYRPGPWCGQLLHSLDFALFPPPATNDKWHPGRKEFSNTIGQKFERSIQNSYLNAIRSAERFIYIENQYFIGSGDRWEWPTVRNDVPGAIADRIKRAISEQKPFHVYVIIPMMPEGPAVPGQFSAPPSVRALEFKTMGFMITAVRDALGDDRDWKEYLSFYFPFRSDAAADDTPLMSNDPSVKGSLHERRRKLVFDNKRYMIYVHTKLMIVDDRFVMLGSANLNERSLAGDRDTEVCVALWPSSNRVEEECEGMARELRVNLMKEHVPGILPDNSEAPESAAFRDEFQTIAKATTNRLLSGGKPLSRLAMLPVDVADDDGDLVWIRPEWIENEDAPAEFIVDSLQVRPYWAWQSDISNFFTTMNKIIE